MLYTFKCLSLVILLAFSALAQDIRDYALRDGIGGRGAGMGGAQTAVANDGSAVFYNPAALASPGFSLSLGNPDSQQKIQNGNFQLLKLGYLGYGNWKTQTPNTDFINTTAYALGGRSGWLNFGWTYKQLDWHIDSTGSSGWSNDIGFLARLTPQLDFGLVAQDLLTSKDCPIKAGGRSGLAFRLLDERLLLAADATLDHNDQLLGHLGVETYPARGLALRAGLDQTRPTAGLTLNFGVLSLDYAAQFYPTQTVQYFEAGFKLIPASERPFSLIKPKEYLLLDLAGSLRGGRSEMSLLGGTRIGLDTILSQLRAANSDSGIDGIMLKLGGFDGGLGGMAMVQEIRAELKRSRDKGKKIIAYVEDSAVGDEYYLAAMADKIVAPPGAVIGGLAKSIEIDRLSGAFKKFGIEWQVLTQGKYKAAFDSLSPKMTPPQKAMLEGLVADLYRQMLTDIAHDRNLPIKKVKEFGDGLIFPARSAAQMGLVDKLGYFDDAKKLAANILGESSDEAKFVVPKNLQPEETLFGQVFGVAVIEIDGEIVQGKGGDNLLFGGRYIGADTVCRNLHQAADDNLVKAVILRINSPGGDANAAGEIYQAVKYVKSKSKTIIASIGNMGASGGYYIAAGGDKIVADGASLVGSIGVIGAIPMYKKLYDKLNITAEVVKEGDHADMFSGKRSMTTIEVAAVERLQAEAYAEFIQAVADGRQMPTVEVSKLAEGRLYTGSQALEVKLIDKLGGFSAAQDLAKELAKLKGEPRLIFYHEPGMLFQLGEGLTESLGVGGGLFSR